jgi:CRISPR-associated protein Cas5t
MAVVVIEAVAPVASWRPPEALTYHRTLPLPPYTALVGTLGAALGQDLPGAYRGIAERGLRLGIGGWHEGQARDLWKFQKLESVADQKKEVKTDVLLRELWIDVRLVIVIEAPSTAIAEEVASAFRQPVYPLTAGTSDALMQAVAVRIEDLAPQLTRRLAYAMIYGELSPRYQLFEALADIPLGRIIRAPSVERLPTGFSFEPDIPRRLLGREVVTFVADPIELDDAEEPVNGYPIEPQSLLLRNSPVFDIVKGAAPWVIPVHRYDSPPTQAALFSKPPSPSERNSRTGRSNKPTGST